MSLEIDVEAFLSNTLGFELPNKWFVQATVDEEGIVLEVFDENDNFIDSEDKTWDEFLVPDDNEEREVKSSDAEPTYRAVQSDDKEQLTVAETSEQESESNDTKAGVSEQRTQESNVEPTESEQRGSDNTAQ